MVLRLPGSGHWSCRPRGQSQPHQPALLRSSRNIRISAGQCRLGRSRQGEGQVQGHESGAEGCAQGADGACRAPHKNHSVAVSLMEGGCEDHWPGAPRGPLEHRAASSLSGAGSGRPQLRVCALGDSGRTGRRPVGLGELSLSVSSPDQGLTQDQLFSKSESRSSLLFVGRSGGPR